MVLLFLSGWLLGRVVWRAQSLATLMIVEDGEWEVEREDLSEGHAVDTSTLTLLRERPRLKRSAERGRSSWNCFSRFYPTDGKTVET